MPYITSVERLSEKRGQERGILIGQERGETQGRMAVLLKALKIVCKAVVPRNLEDRVRKLSLDELKALEDVLENLVESLADLEGFLDSLK